MATIPGLMLTGLTSKAGILSRKASIRLATETGEKVLLRKQEIGRNLNTEELEQVFAETLPKKCRPKIITTEAEVIECLKREGLNDEQINAQLITNKANYFSAANIFNGTKRMPIYMPKDSTSWIPMELKPYLDYIEPATVAHEVEHSLEMNCRIFGLFKRKTVKIRKFLGTIIDKNYSENLNNREIEVHKFERWLHQSLQPIVEVNQQTCTMKMNCVPTLEGMSKSIGGDENLFEILRRIMREDYANGLNKDSETRKRLNLMRYWMDIERPAYEVTGNIERKIYNLKAGEYAASTGVSKGYEIAKDVAIKERRIYWMNKLFGRFIN